MKPDRNTVIFPKRIQENKKIQDRIDRKSQKPDSEFTRLRREVEARNEIKKIESELNFGFY